MRSVEAVVGPAAMQLMRSMREPDAPAVSTVWYSTGALREVSPRDTTAGVPATPTFGVIA